MAVFDERAAYTGDRNDADKFIPHQRQIISAIFKTRIEEVEVSDDLSDRTKVADLFVDSKIFKVALRKREDKYFQRNWNEITFRMPSEWQKVIAGEGDWALYGFHNDGEVTLHTWTLIWLHGLRQAINDRAQLKGLKGRLLASGMAEDVAEDVVNDTVSTVYERTSGILSPIVPYRNGQNAFTPVDILKLQKGGYNIIHDTSDPRLAVDERVSLWTPDGTFIRKGGEL